MKKNIFFLLITIITLSTGCLRLDDMLYNESPLDFYKLDNYDGEIDFRLDESYSIPDSLVHLFTLESQTATETFSTKIYAIYLGDTNRIATDTIIMYCHGNRDHMDFYWQREKLLANIGDKNRFGVLMLDYRGFGMSEGKSTEESLYADVDAGLAWLKNHGLTNDRLIIYGFSLGSAPATELTAHSRSLTPSKLILESPFASAAVMVQDGSILAIPPSYFTNLEIDNAEEIKLVNQPFLWFHGIDDDFLNIETHGEVIFKNYHGEKGIAVRVPGANHGGVPQTYGFVSYCKQIEEFITGKY